LLRYRNKVKLSTNCDFHNKYNNTNGKDRNNINQKVSKDL
jgi:hypothetical protein